jgi:7-carboxy-7-deazaguanine synthase
VTAVEPGAVATAGAESVILAERFVSVQGEGPLCGQRCAFVRLSRCNLDGAWCDTPYTWDWTRFEPSKVASRVAVGDLAVWVTGTGVELLVVTGDEQLLQQDALSSMLARLPAAVRVQVETNGTRAPVAALAERVELWVVSPKLASSGVPLLRRIVPEALAALRRTGQAAFKFVVCDVQADVAEIAALVDAHALTPVWVMPEGTTVAAVLAGTAALLGPASERGWNISTRLHVLAGAR